MASLSDFEKCVSRSIRASIATKVLLLKQSEVLSAIADVSRLLVDTFRRGNKVLLFGNGGSAADAQHIAAEFVGRFAFSRPPLPALALNVNSSSVTAIGNDFGFDQVFSRQIAAMACPGDTAIAISTSGRSPNVVHAISVAKRLGLHTVGMTGSRGSELRDELDYCICVPSAEAPRIQECHILIGHVITELVENAMFPDESNSSRIGLQHQC